MRRLLLCATVLAAAFGASAGTEAIATQQLGDGACTPRTLILAAMPLELNPLIRSSTTDASDVSFMVHGRRFYEGTLAGDVAGCEPCFVPNDQPAYAADFVERFPTVVDPSFWFGLAQQSGTPPGETFVAGDMETAATAEVAPAALSLIGEPVTFAVHPEDFDDFVRHRGFRMSISPSRASSRSATRPARAP